MSEPAQASDPLFLDFQQALAGRYSIDRELGRGGMGVVYLAREVHLDRLVAIKLLPPALAARRGLRERFVREAQLAARLSHPHIIPIHAVHESGQFVYFVMAYVDGQTLAQRVQSRGPLSVGDGTRLLREVAWALGHAHAQGLVHRDVKPDNILIEAGSGRALVADFGIAAASSDATRGAAAGDATSRPHEEVCGTPEFMSPEQARGREMDARSDLYSLGATAFYALSGRVPFEGRSAAEVLARHISEPAPSLDGVGLSVPRRLARLVDACLAKEADARPASAEALAAQLGLAIEQRRELPAALRAFVKRDGRLDGGGTVLALLGSATAGVVVAATAGLAAGVGVMLGTALIGPPLFALFAARRLLRLGFTHADLAPAFRSEQESSREERRVQPRRVRALLERAAGAVARVAATTTLLTAGVALFSRNATAGSALATVAGVGVALTVAATIAHLALMQQRRDVDVEFWSRIWSGRFGTWAFETARRLRGSTAPARAMTHRATELSLSLAAEALFESLPEATQASLGDVPALLQRLQHDATRVREELANLQDADALADPMRAVRDQLQERLRDTVSAMETLRLDLLRLHAGALSLERFTTQLEHAADLSDDIGRLLDAQDEVADALRLPHRLELTPV